MSKELEMRDVFSPWRTQSTSAVSSAKLQCNKLTINDQKEFSLMEQEKLNSNPTGSNGVTPETRGSRGKGGKHNKKKHQDPKVNTTDTQTSVPRTTGINVFYPIYGSLSDRHKYCISHYEIMLGCVDAIDAIGQSSTTPYLDAEVGKSITSINQIRFGGPGFHNKVVEAAYAANAKYLVSTAALEPLLNAFYGYLYNSRQLYALLCTAWRCQNQVNIIDEDQLYVGPMLNNHKNKNLAQGWSVRSLAEETNCNTFAVNTVRQGYCFSSATSNGVWANSVITPVLQHVRLPKGWRNWVEDKFMNCMAADPTDFNAVPRFVVFWPDGTYVTGPSSTASVNNFTSYAKFDATNQTSNASIQDLISHINAVVTEQVDFINMYPQLELMFMMLDCNCGSTSFTRDLDAKSIKMKHSFSVSKFVESVALPFRVVAGNSTETTVYTYYEKGGADTYLFIARDPQAKETAFKTFELSQTERGRSANITYIDRCELDEADYALCNWKVAPIGYNVIVQNSTNGRFLWNFPLPGYMAETGYTSTSYMAPTGQFNNVDSNFVQAIVEMLEIYKQQGFVLPRLRLAVTGTPTTTNCLPLSAGGGAFTPYYDLKDYRVPQLEARGWIDDYADVLALC